MNEWYRLYKRPELALIISMVKKNPQACSLDEIPQGVGEFGLVVTNPIPTFGIPSNRVYLDSLRLPNGESIEYRRRGSTYGEGIEYPIDVYDLFDRYGLLIKTIYISPYHWVNSRKAPAGFYLDYKNTLGWD